MTSSRHDKASVSRLTHVESIEETSEHLLLKEADATGTTMATALNDSRNSSCRSKATTATALQTTDDHVRLFFDYYDKIVLGLNLRTKVAGTAAVLLNNSFAPSAAASCQLNTSTNTIDSDGKSTNRLVTDRGDCKKCLCLQRQMTVVMNLVEMLRGKIFVSAQASPHTGRSSANASPPRLLSPGVDVQHQDSEKQYQLKTFHPIHVGMSPSSAEPASCFARTIAAADAVEKPTTASTRDEAELENVLEPREELTSLHKPNTGTAKGLHDPRRGSPEALAVTPTAEHNQNFVPRPPPSESPPGRTSVRASVPASSSPSASRTLPTVSVPEAVPLSDDGVIRNPTQDSTIGAISTTKQIPSSSFLLHDAKKKMSLDMSVMSCAKRRPTIITQKAEMTEDDVGTEMLNNYIMMDFLGEGATGTVHLAFSVTCNEQVAIKMVTRSKKQEQQLHRQASSVSAAPTTKNKTRLGRLNEAREEALRQEVAVMKRLRHKNIVSLYEVIDDPASEATYLVMQYVDGGSIGKISRDGSCSTKLPLPRVAEVARQVLAGLDYLHSRGVSHRDVKPENILVNSTGEVFLSDFGAAVEFGTINASSSADVLNFAGTPLFMAPELLQLRYGTAVGTTPEVAKCATKTSYDEVTRQYSETSQVSATQQPLDPPPDPTADSPPAHQSSVASLFAAGACAADAADDTSDDDESRTADASPASVNNTEEASSASTSLAAACAADMWALGVSLHALSCGRMPFTSIEDVLAFAHAGPATTATSPLAMTMVEAVDGTSLDEEWKQIIAALLHVNPSERPSAFIARCMVKDFLKNLAIGVVSD